MKSYPCWVFGLALFSQSVYPEYNWALASTMIKQETAKHQRLKVGHLPRVLLNQLSSLASLTYATGHDFYDTEVILTEKNGNMINFKDQLNANTHYKIANFGKTDLVAKWIWFFSPEGVQVTDGDIVNQCTAEFPCKEITQTFVNNLNDFLTANQLKGKLWLASGAYDLPLNLKKNSAHLLNLYGRISITGRTPDFRHIAYNDERPLLKGSLSWNDNLHHGRTEGRVKNIRMRTDENRIPVKDMFVNVNIHSTGDVEVINSDLQITNCESGKNIHADFIKLIDSTLSSTGENAINIASKGLYIEGSQLRVKGADTHNLQVSEGFVDVYKSNLETRVDSCHPTMNSTFAIQAESSSDLHLVASHIVMESTAKCPLASMTAIAAGTTPYLSIIDSSILMKSSYEDLIAIENNYFSVELTKSKIGVKSLNGKAYAFWNYHTALEFTGEPSTIHVTSPALAALYMAPEIIRISNKSIPSSQCQINEENPVNC